ncbi:hypothetical protein JCM11251_002471 [Rhodosporidiobolus azoricus]
MSRGATQSLEAACVIQPQQSPVERQCEAPPFYVSSEGLVYTTIAPLPRCRFLDGVPKVAPPSSYVSSEGELAGPSAPQNQSKLHSLKLRILSRIIAACDSPIAPNTLPVTSTPGSASSSARQDWHPEPEHGGLVFSADRPIPAERLHQSPDCPTPLLSHAPVQHNSSLFTTQGCPPHTRPLHSKFCVQATTRPPHRAVDSYTDLWDLIENWRPPCSQVPRADCSSPALPPQYHSSQNGYFDAVQARNDPPKYSRRLRQGERLM